MWHHYEDVVQLIHVRYIGLTMSVALLRGRRYRDVYLRLSQNIDPFLDLLGKMNLQTPC